MFDLIIRGGDVVTPQGAVNLIALRSASATNSAACLRISAALAVAQRVSIRTLRPMESRRSASTCLRRCSPAPTR